MKKTAIFALLLVLALSLTSCGGPKTFAEADPADYLTLGNYKELIYVSSGTAVSDYEVTVALNKALNEKGYAKEEKNVDIQSGVVQIGDTINLDYRGLKDGVAFQGGTAEDQSLTIGSGKFIAGFEEGLVGKAIGSDVKLNLTFPENYGNEELNGADVIFEVTINSVTDRTTYSELTDEIAKELDKDAETAKEYLDNLRKKLKQQKENSAKEDQKNTLWGQVIAGAKFEEKLPKKLVKNSVKEFNEYYEAAAKQNSYTNFEDFLKDNGLTRKDFDAQAQSYAENIVKSQLTAYAVAKAEGYTLTQDAIDTSAAQYAAQYGYADVQKYIDAVGIDAVKDQAILDYAVNLVIENAKFEEK